MSKKIKIKNNAVLALKKSSARHIKTLKEAFYDGSLGDLLIKLKQCPENTVPIIDTVRLKESKIVKAIFDCVYITDAEENLRLGVITGYIAGKHALAKNAVFNLLALGTYTVEGTVVTMSKDYKWMVVMPDGTEKELRQLVME